MSVLHIRKPVVFTADGSLGELLPAVRAHGGSELAIVEGQAISRPDLLAHLRDSVVSVQRSRPTPPGRQYGTNSEATSRPLPGWSTRT